MGKRIHDTTSDLFLNTIKMAREAGALDALDAIVDYEMPTGGASTGDNIELTKYEFDTAFSVNIGASEGIYIDAYIDGYFRQVRCRNIGASAPSKHFGRTWTPSGSWAKQQAR